MVEVKYEEHDDTTWEPFSHMQEELGDKMFKKFINDIIINEEVWLVCACVLGADMLSEFSSLQLL